MSDSFGISWEERWKRCYPAFCALRTAVDAPSVDDATYKGAMDTGIMHGPARSPYVLESFSGGKFMERERMTIMRANRLATDDERAYAWQTLMASVEPTSSAAIDHAVQAFIDRVTYRFSQKESN